MLSICKLSGSAGDIENYLRGEHAGKENYYSEKGQQAGCWLGKGAAELGLAGGYSSEKFQALLSGCDPRTGEKLTHGQRPGWDLTFSCPKSVSSVFAIAGDEQRQGIEAAQAAAVAKSISFIEEHLEVARRGAGGHEKEKGGLVAAAFQHATSRAGDPDLHTHCAISNLVHRAGGGWGTAEPAEIYRWKMSLGAIYRAELAENLRQLGYDITPGTGDSFEISGVPEKLRDQWSQRRHEIEKSLSESGRSGARAAEVAALASRSPKKTASQEELRAGWSDQAAGHGFTQEVAAGLASHQPQPAAALDVEKLLAGLTQNESVFEKRQVVRALAVELQTAGGGAGRIKEETARLLSNHELVKLGHGKFTTREIQKIERAMVASAAGRAADTAHSLSLERVDAALAAFKAARGFELSGEQAAAVRQICSAPGAVQLVQGAAGAGKSTMAEAARVAWESDGYHVRGAALAGKAAKGLEESAGIKSQTLHSLIRDLETGKETLSKNTVVVIDEAGMIGSRQMSKLVEYSEKSGAKLVLIGDSRQLQAIDAGGAFKALQNKLGAGQLDEIRRQRSTEDRDFVNDLAAGRAAEALEKLRDAGRLHAENTPAAAAEKLISRWSETRDPARPGESLILAGTRAEVRLLNKSARSEMAEKGFVGGPEIDGFATGDRVLFTKNDRKLGVQNGLLGTVESVNFTENGGYLSIKTDDGKSVKIDPQQYESLEYGYAVTVHKAQGVTVDNAFVLAGDMTNREWGYVAGSRHRESLEIFCDHETAEDLGLQLAKSQQKGTSLDYEIEAEAELEAEIEPPAPQPQEHEAEPAQVAQEADFEAEQDLELEDEEELEL